MGKAPWAVYFWPGLPQMWRRGSWAGLLVAAVCAVLVNLLLLATFLWSEALRWNVRWAGWSALAVLWILAAMWSRIEENREARRELRRMAGDAFPQAMDAYLKGQWFEAECFLAELLDRRPEDVEARLLLATLYRHTRRCEEARVALDHLERLEGAGKWLVEIVRERALLEEMAGTGGASSGASAIDRLAGDSRTVPSSPAESTPQRSQPPVDTPHSATTGSGALGLSAAGAYRAA